MHTIQSHKLGRYAIMKLLYVFYENIATLAPEPVTNFTIVCMLVSIMVAITIMSPELIIAQPTQEHTPPGT